MMSVEHNTLNSCSVEQMKNTVMTKYIDTTKVWYIQSCLYYHCQKKMYFYFRRSTYMSVYRVEVHNNLACHIHCLVDTLVWLHCWTLSISSGSHQMWPVNLLVIQSVDWILLSQEVWTKFYSIHMVQYTHVARVHKLQNYPQDKHTAHQEMSYC